MGSQARVPPFGERHANEDDAARGARRAHDRLGGNRRCGVAAAGQGAERHGGHRAAARVGGGRGGAPCGRQRGRRSGGGRLRARRRASLLRQHRRRRVCDAPHGRRQGDLLQLPRKGARRGGAGHVSRRYRRTRARPQHRRIQGGGRAGDRDGARGDARGLRHHVARGAARAGDPAGEGRLRPHRGRCRDPRRRRPRISPGRPT